MRGLIGVNYYVNSNSVPNLRVVVERANTGALELVDTQLVECKHSEVEVSRLYPTRDIEQGTELVWKYPFLPRLSGNN